MDKIAEELRLIRELLERFLVVPEPPTVLEQKLGGDAISYLDEAALMLADEEELRLKDRGILPSG